MTPGALDLAVVRRHLAALDEALQRLRGHQHDTEADLAANGDAAWAIERGLQLCTQNALDIATHIVASAGHDVADYATAIDRLGDLGVLPVDFAGRFRGIAGFRNVLVHGYLGLDRAIVVQLLQTGLGDFVTFAGHVNRYIESRHASP
jgi:uncharacterized protein YutE (UPF0331/DUF86 family)